MGYGLKEEKIVIAKNAFAVVFVLKEEVKAVSVTAGSFAAGDKKRVATVLSALDMYTTGGVNADVTAAIKTLPVAQQVDEQEGLFVQGGEGSETTQIIDGFVVNNPLLCQLTGYCRQRAFCTFFISR
ncbi:MAG: hypothetical protein EKK39_09565 [Sphingobacteriales bacterium]|uniref:hypothetical protein n=1 Tax=Hydrotalea flava TaxID=714549 RepID=UPI0008344418|nr:hypothetical protein [Hydrotalea flava]RTL50524.1 MAG: hypothetical protein EKK39_09565 [Sphingobacteriales bacterium]